MRRGFLIPLLILGTIGGYASGFASMARYRSGGWDDGDRCGRWSRYRESYDAEMNRRSVPSSVTVARPTAPAATPAPAAVPAPVTAPVPQQVVPQIVIVQPAPQVGGWQQPMVMPQYMPPQQIYVPVPQGSWPVSAPATAPVQTAPAAPAAAPAGN